MSKTYKDRKLHQGEIQKRINEEKKREQKIKEEEARQAATWYDPKRITKCDLNKEKAKEDALKKERLRKLYEEEFNNA